MSHDGNDIKVSFCPVPMPEVQEEIKSASVTYTGESDKSNTREPGKRSFGPQPKFDNPNFDFKEELGRLPFPVNIGEVELSKAQKVRFLELIYDNQSVFSLCDEDLGLYDCLKHTIPTTTDKPVYLSHHTISVQLCGEVCKCLDIWLKQVII